MLPDVRRANWGCSRLRPDRLRPVSSASRPVNRANGPAISRLGRTILARHCSDVVILLIGLSRTVSRSSLSSTVEVPCSGIGQHAAVRQQSLGESHFAVALRAARHPWNAPRRWRSGSAAQPVHPRPMRL